MDNNNGTNKYTDHDLLIRLDTKIGTLTDNVKEIKDNTQGAIALLQGKIVSYDQLLVEYPPKKLSEMIYAHEAWIGNFKLTWKIILATTIVLSSVITFVLTTLGQLLHLAGFFGK